MRESGRELGFGELKGDFMEDISLLERIDANLCRIIESLPEGKLKEVAEETKKDFNELQESIFELDDLRHELWKVYERYWELMSKMRKVMKKIY